MWLNNAVPLNFCRRKFIFELKDLLYNKLLMEETLKNILKFKENTRIKKNSSDMNRREQESSRKIFLKKLLEFTKKITIYKKNSNQNLFRRNPSSLNNCFFILLDAMAKIEISIYTRCIDATI
jgi:hypothetical protein